MKKPESLRPFVPSLLLLAAMPAFLLLACGQSVVAEEALASRVLTAVAGTPFGVDVASDEDVDQAVLDLAPYFDILWVRIPPWDKDILHRKAELRRMQLVIDRTHAVGRRVAFCFSWAGLLPPAGSAAEEGLAGYLLNPATGTRKLSHAWDYGSSEALEEFRRRCRQLFDAVARPVEMLVVDEEIMGEPGRNFWYQPISTYWTSPTYSAPALRSFRRFLERKGIPGATRACFPATTKSLPPGPRANEGLPAVPLGPDNQDFLIADDGWPSSPLWQAWYEWRTELYCRWLDAVGSEAQARWGGRNDWLGCQYVMPDFWAQKELGQDLSRIAALDSVDYLVAGYNSGSHFDWFAYAASLKGKKWGCVVQTCTYGKRSGTPPEVIEAAFDKIVRAGASIIDVYAGANFLTRRREPRDDGLYYMPEQVKAWQRCVRKLHTGLHGPSGQAEPKKARE